MQVYDHLDRGLDAMDEGERSSWLGPLLSSRLKCLCARCSSLISIQLFTIALAKTSCHLTPPFFCPAASAVIAAKDNMPVADRIEMLRVQVTGGRDGRGGRL